MRQLISTVSILCLLVFSLSCSKDELGNFEKNDPEPEFKLFTMLDNYPAIRSAFNSVDSYRFNDLLCQAMNDIPGDVKAVLEVVEDLLVNKRTNTLSSTRSILYRILNQDELDREPVARSNDPGYATKDFPYYDMIADSIDSATEQKLNLTKPLLAMMRKVFAYFKYRFTPVELEEVMEDFIAHLRDDDANIMKVLFEEILAKMYFQTNESVWFNDKTDDHEEFDMQFSVGDSLCSRDDIGKAGTVDTHLGNAVRGADASFSGQEDEMKDPAFREAYYEVLREAGKMMSATVSAGGEVKDYGTVFRELVCNLEKYFTKGGEVFESNGGNNDYNRGYVYDVKDEDGNFVIDEEGKIVSKVVGEVNPNTGKEEYVSAELGNTIREMFAVLSSLFKRSDREHAASYYNENDEKKNKKYYFLTRYFEILRDMGFDPDKAHLEERLYDILRFDVWGRDRLKNWDIEVDFDKDSNDEIDEKMEKRPFAASHMNHMMLLIGMGENYGYFDSAYTDETDPDVNYGHGALESSGYLSLNDILCYIGFKELLGVNLYELALRGTKWDGDHSFRSVYRFSASQALDFRNPLNTEVNVVSLMPTQLCGDAGVPWGGNPKGWDATEEDLKNPDYKPDGIPSDDVEVPLNFYRPYNSDGRGEPDIINLFLTSFVRYVWDGQGPYYCTEGMKKEGNVYTYYRPEGSIYTHVTKPDPNNPVGDIVNETDPYCFEKDDIDVRMVVDALERDDDVIKGIITDEDDLNVILDAVAYAKNGDVAADEFIGEILRYIKKHSDKELSEFYADYFNKYQEFDDWQYVYPVSGREDLPYEEDQWDYDPERAQRGGRKNCRYEQKVQTDYSMMHLDNVFIFYDKELLERDVNDDGEITNFVDETGEYTGLDPATTTDEERLVREKLPPGLYDVYSVSNEEIGIYGDIGDEKEPVDRLLVAAEPKDRIPWENEQMDKFKSGRLTMYEMIPEKCVERECDTKIETLYRNLLFYLADKKFAVGVPIYMGISVGEVLAAVLSLVVSNPFFEGAMKDFIYWFNDATPLGYKLVQAGVIMVGEGNGAIGLGKLRFYDFEPEEMGPYPNVNGKWDLKRNKDVDLDVHPNGIITGGQSFFASDSRLYITYTADDLFNCLGTLVFDFLDGDILKFIADAYGLMTGTLEMSYIKEGFASFMLNSFLARGSLLGGGLSACMPGFCRMAFPRCVDPRNPSETIKTVGSRKGGLLKDRDWKCVVKPGAEPHPEWGFEANDNDPNWPNRQSFLVEAFIAFVIALRECGGSGIESFEQFYNTRGKNSIFAPNTDYNPSKAVFDTVIGALMSPMMYYQPGEDGAMPRNTWSARFVDYHDVYMRTDLIENTTGQDSWVERAYYQLGNVVNLFTLPVDSDSSGDFHDAPQRCDSLLPLLTEYDVTRPVGPDNPPNTRLITALYKLAMLFTDPKYDERPEGKAYKEEDFSTWSTREKIRYGTEQFVSTMKCRKGDRIKINERDIGKNQRTTYWPEVYKYPIWMFSDNGIREEDIDLDRIIDEWIGSDESGKGLAIIPDSRPNPEDWENFSIFFDALGELMSNNGKTKGEFNIMEDIIEFIDLMNLPDASNEHLKGLRHTVGSMITYYNEDNGSWEYPDELLNIISTSMPDILETFRGRYYSLCTLIDSLMKEDGFLEYLIYSLDCTYSGREIFEQLHAFLGEDYIAQHDSFFWSDFAELLTAFAAIINAESLGIEDISARDAIGSAEPFDGLGELLSW